MNLEPHQLRMMEEREQLADRLQKLKQFIECPAFAQQSRTEQILMIGQSRFMQEYLANLDQRINLFTAPLVEETGWIKYADEKPKARGFYLYADKETSYCMAFYTMTGWKEMPALGHSLNDPIYWRAIHTPAGTIYGIPTA